MNEQMRKAKELVDKLNEISNGNAIVMMIQEVDKDTEQVIFAPYGTGSGFYKMIRYALKQNEQFALMMIQACHDYILETETPEAQA